MHKVIRKYIVIFLGFIFINSIKVQTINADNKSSKEAKRHMETGIDYDRRGVHDKAMLEFKKAVELDSNMPMAYVYLAGEHFFFLRFNDALEEYKKALEIDPKCKEAYNGIGSLYFMNKNYDEAIINFRKAIEIDPDYSDAHSGLGSVYEKKEMLDEAELELQKTIALNPRDFMAYSVLGDVYKTRGLYEKAKYYNDKGLEILKEITKSARDKNK